MSLQNPRGRPWYCHEELTNEWLSVANSGGDYKMLKSLKIIRSIIVNLGLIIITLYALVATGADATVVAAVGLGTLGMYNGVEVADYAALAQAFKESKQNQEDNG